MSVIVGSFTDSSPLLFAGLQLTDTQHGREPGGLRTVTYFYEGPQTSVTNAITSLPSDYGFRTSASDAPKISLQVIVPNPEASDTNEDMAFQWDLPGNDDVKSLLEHPTVLGWHRKLQDSIRSAVKNEHNDTYDERVTALEAAAVSYIEDTPAAKGLVVGFFNNILNEQSLIVPQYVLRLTQAVGSRYSKQISDANVRKVYTTPQLIAEASANLTPIPDRIKYKIEHIDPLPNATGRLIDEFYGVNNFTWGWLKKSSTEGQVAGGKIEIQTEWVLDLWSELTYQLAT